MKGILTTDPTQGDLSFEIPKGEVFFGQDVAGKWLLSERAPAIPTIKFVWDLGRITWKVFRLSDNVRLDGLGIPKEGRRLLDENVLQVGDWNFRLQKIIDVPQFEGGLMGDRIRLGGLDSLVIGRDVGDSESGKLALDRDDRTISKIHVNLRKSAKGWEAEDASKTGTELNGLLFGKTKLVFGDRIRISSYLFEFGGDHLRRIDHLNVGSLEARNVTVEVPDRETGKPLRILDDVTVDIQAGEFIGILGGSGQGKSTLLNALCGIRPGTSGGVRIGGVPVELLIKNRPGSIGYVPQDDIVHPELTVIQAFRYSARLRLPLPKAEREQLISRTIEVLGLTDHQKKRVFQLSGGQRKRVSIGIELLSKPDILFLDEPSSGLDPGTEKSLMELLQALSLTNLTVICTTHVLQNAYLFNRLLFVHGARLIFEGSAGQAREYFLGSSNSETVTASIAGGRGVQSPLEKIYPTVLDSKMPSLEWQKRFETSQFYQPPKVAPADSDEKRAKTKRVGAGNKFRVLLRRQVSILTSDWLNLAFLLSQALIIGILVAWVSDDLGFRMFLGIIAAMWFGCSNGAQQIVAELAIFKRERICGLGVNTYVFSKLAFQSVLTTTQALLLFVVIILGGKWFHEDDFDQEVFLERLEERQNPLVIDDSQAGSVDDFMPIALDDGGGLELPPDDGGGTESEAEAKPKARNETKMVSSLATVAQYFDLKNNILDSGDRPLSNEDFTPMMGEDQRQKVLPGVDPWRVVGISLGLKFGAFVFIAIVGVGIGLVISCLVRSATQAVMWVPLVLIPQILFGGFVISVPEMSSGVRSVARFFPSFAGQRMIDVSHLYGRRAPKLTNQTKTPTFLTSDGDKETIEWMRGDITISQDFEKISEVNTSWQNLAVLHDRIGHHEHATDEGYDSGSSTKRETVEERNDVMYRQGTVFKYLYLGGAGAATLGVWLLLSFMTMQVGLRIKR